VAFFIGTFLTGVAFFAGADFFATAFLAGAAFLGEVFTFTLFLSALNTATIVL
jgi:hypothetical protein